MYNTKLARNDLKNKPVIKTGYCAAQYLFRGLERVGYMAGVYGWNADVYDCGAAYIVTGYRFTGLRGKYADHDFLTYCDKVAENLCQISADPAAAIADLRRRWLQMEIND